VRSNPGLSSRIGTHLQFDDYTPTQLLGIFRRQATQQKYHLPLEVTVQSLRGFHWLHARRDEHFGNGRVVRNVFEATVRRMASRIAGITPVTHRLLTDFQPEDLSFPDIPVQVWRGVSQESISVRLRCHSCSRQVSLRDTELLSRPSCPDCGELVRGG
jgi:DNA-directed RNA polymerase subunit RPC12/RpoP